MSTPDIHAQSCTKACLLQDIGRICYSDALKLQNDLHDRCAVGDIPGVLILLEHDPVITLGVKNSSRGNVLASPKLLKANGVELVETDRGGDVTYHGPGQLVGYPIVRLRELTGDVHSYLRLLEQSIIDTLAEFGLEGHRNGPAGVWVADKKVCSIGIAVRKWVTYHGFALNVDPNLSHFALINPCGLHSEQITSMAKLLGYVPEMRDVRDVYARAFSRIFNVELQAWCGPT
ncbi:lipoyl(octanoyl) transferase LipB [bacterium]|nr:lipoyl(octanoyl) transferase LipB [bacterium]